MPHVLMCFSSLKNTSDSLFPLGSLLQMLLLCSSRHRRLTQGKPYWHFFPEEESFIRNFRLPSGELVLNSTPCGTAQPHLLLQNCFLSAPFLSTHKTMGKCSPLTNILGNHRTCSFYWSIPSEARQSQKMHIIHLASAMMESLGTASPEKKN